MGILGLDGLGCSTYDYYLYQIALIMARLILGIGNFILYSYDLQEKEIFGKTFKATATRDFCI